jgi:hypothetical protein
MSVRSTKAESETRLEPATVTASRKGVGYNIERSNIKDEKDPASQRI